MLVVILNFLALEVSGVSFTVSLELFAHFGRQRFVQEIKQGGKSSNL